VTANRVGQARTGLLLAIGGSFVGPYLGVWMSLEAAHHAPLGVAQTLISLTPILILPFSRMVYHERITPRAICGAVVAVIGVALLFLL
jgi:drug/metabolite transporter (DMT)-like permease